MRKNLNILAAVPVLLAALNLANASELAYVAIPNYSVLVAGVNTPVDLGGIPRGFDFGGTAPFINQYTGVSDIATINYYDQAAKIGTVINSTKIKTLGGAPDHVFKTGYYTAVGYRKGDGIAEGTLRTMLNSFSIPSRKALTWDLSFRLGGATPTTPWTFTPRGVAPATLWQIKAANIAPALVMAVDTDPKDPTSLEISFDQRPVASQAAFRVASVTGLKPNTDIDVRVETFMDDRSAAMGGKGYLRITLNGKVILNSTGPILQGAATSPYYYALAMYLYNNHTPLAFDRFGFWKRASMSVVQ